jgi:hypothetical protein
VAGTNVIAAVAAGLLLALAIGARHESWRQRWIWLSLSWIVLASLPAHFLLLIGPDLTNSRVLYLGSVGIAILLA